MGAAVHRWIPLLVATAVVTVPALPRRAGARGDRCVAPVCDHPMTIEGIPGGIVAHLQGRLLSNGGDDRRLIVQGREAAAGSCQGGGPTWYGELQWRPGDASVAADGALQIRYDDPTRIFEDRSWVGTGAGPHTVPAMDIHVARDGTITGNATFVPTGSAATDAGPPLTFTGTFTGRTALDCYGTTGVLDIPLADGTTLELPCVETPLPPPPACEDHGGGC